MSPKPEVARAIHTPGPWLLHFAASEGDAGFHTIGPSQRLADYVTTSGGRWIADVGPMCDGNGDPANEEAQANAALIAAAPDLLAALRHVLNNYEMAMAALKQAPDAFNASREVIAARAAIAKAEGGAA